MFSYYAVYLIYSADVEYYDSDSIYWAYVAYYLASKENNKTFDGLDVYYYLFAGFDFMDEDIDEWFKNGSDFEVNASPNMSISVHAGELQTILVNLLDNAIFWINYSKKDCKKIML